MKRMVKSDWEYSSENDINALKELMQANIEYQDEPEVGIFWYDVDADDLFGVKSASVSDVDYYQSNLFNCKVKTCRPLHYKVWEKEYFRGKDNRFRGDYTLVPRGRIFFVEGRGPVVVVGNWINDYPSAKTMILDEFNLPEDTEFMIDEHWDLGHGWSDKFM